MAVAVPCFIAALVTSAPTLADGLNAPAYHFGNMHQHPWFWDVVGASAIGWVIGIVKGFSGSKEWLDRYWPRAPLLVVWMLDFLVFVVVGGYLGTGIYNPMTFLAALSAGLSWPIGLGALATKD
jgi:hypothetical protein